MRVALVNGSKRFDGHTVQFHSYVNGLRAVGVEPSIYTCIDPSDADSYAPEGTVIPGWRVPLGTEGEMGFNRLLPILVRRLRAIEGDIIHVNDVYLSRLAAYRDNVLVSVTDLGKLKTRYYNRSSSWLHNLHLRYVNRCRGIICAAESVRAEVIQELDVPADRVHVVPLSTSSRSPSPVSPPLPPSEARPWTLLCVATDRPHKNIGGFLEVVKRLGPSYRGLLVSRLTDATRRRIDAEGLGKRIEVRADVSNLADLYRSAQVLVFPSLYEGFGIPLIEAMRHGLPVVAARRTTIPEVLGEGGTAVEPGDYDAWVTAITALTDADRYREAARRSWERGALFGPEQTGRALVKAYEAARQAPGPLSSK